MKAKIENPKFILCDCHGHALGLEYDRELGYLYLGFWQRGKYQNSFLERLRIAWHILRNGHEFGDDICLNKQKVNQLKKHLDAIK